MSKPPIELLLDGVEWKPSPPLPESARDGLPYATHEGVLHVGDLSLRCYTLNDGRRIFDAEDVNRFFLGLDAEPEPTRKPKRTRKGGSK